MAERSKETIFQMSQYAFCLIFVYLAAVQSLSLIPHLIPGTMDVVSVADSEEKRANLGSIIRAISDAGLTPKL